MEKLKNRRPNKSAKKGQRPI
uniref:Uncharacterized protein n=1 Tax=Rhizophora mucronata TaxID=61149 RepID=A0A2P2QZU2_RHIMU